MFTCGNSDKDGDGSNYSHSISRCYVLFYHLMYHWLILIPIVPKATPSARLPVMDDLESPSQLCGPAASSRASASSKSSARILLNHYSEHMTLFSKKKEKKKKRKEVQRIKYRFLGLGGEVTINCALVIFLTMGSTRTSTVWWIMFHLSQL